MCLVLLLSLASLVDVVEETRGDGWMNERMNHKVDRKKV